MSSFPKLDIKLSDIKRYNFTPPSGPEPPPPSQSKNIKKIYVVYAMAIICCVYMFFTMTPTRNLKPRRIIRLQCSTHMDTQSCVAPYGFGEFVVTNCNAFEFNSIPFTELTKIGDNYRIPLSNDMTIRIKQPCPNIIATLDTQQLIPYQKQYATLGGKYTKRLVWVTYNCYSAFSLSIGNEKIFDNTPPQMIDKVIIGNMSAYIYESPGVYGSIQLSGTGCKFPFHIYSI